MMKDEACIGHTIHYRQRKISFQSKRKAAADPLFARMYADWAVGRITEYRFNLLLPPEARRKCALG